VPGVRERVEWRILNGQNERRFRKSEVLRGYLVCLVSIVCLVCRMRQST
jgi:hypothetical protein